MNLYIIKQNVNLLENLQDENAKIIDISNILEISVRNSTNLNFLLGSGCSLKAIPLTKEVANKIIADDELKEIIQEYNNESNSETNLEDLLNWLNSSIIFYKNNQSLFDKYYEVFNKCKNFLFNAIKQRRG